MRRGPFGNTRTTPLIQQIDLFCLNRLPEPAKQCVTFGDYDGSRASYPVGRIDMSRARLGFADK